VETADQEAWVLWFAEWTDAHPDASASHAGPCDTAEHWPR
jgi:hypothetical protein